MPPVVEKRKREGIQLCKVYQPGKKTNPKNFIVEPKFDGIRGIIIKQGGITQALTSTGLKIWNVDHILKAVADCTAIDNMVFDGEFLSPELGFDITSGLTRKFEADERAKTINFYAWDCMSHEEFSAKECKSILMTRKAVLNTCVTQIADWQFLEVKYRFGKTQEELEALCRHWVANGYEGGVIKATEGLYEFKKSNAWLKWKPYKEGDFQIYDAIEGRGKHVGRLGALKIRGTLLPDGNISPEFGNDCQQVIESEVGTGFDDAQRELYWGWHSAGALVGRTVEVKYQDISKDGALRFPVFHRLREDKDV